MNELKLLDINYKNATLSFFKEKISHILLFFPNNENITEKIVEEISSEIKDEFDFNDYNEKINKLLCDMFGKIPLASLVMDDIMVEYKSFIDFLYELFNVFGFDENNFSNKNIENIAVFISKTCDKDDLVSSINYSSLNFYWNTLYVGTKNCFSSKSIKISAISFMEKNCKLKFKEYIEHIKQ